jgi:N-sulfoglucosamine sulfohydrolase
MNKLLVVPVALGMVSCGGSGTALPPPNILWITHEDLSPIYGCYGDDYARTPNIDLLAESGYRFTNAFSNAPISAPARSTLITGMYATSLGTQHLRSDIPVPADMKTLPEVLRQAGYYTTNNVKTDYNFDHTGRWDESSSQAHWRNRPRGKPFFSVFNFMITHEGPINALRSSDTQSLEAFSDPDLAQLPPYLPDSQKMRQIWAHMYDLLAVFDQGVGDLVGQLIEDGLYENTIIFVFSDHGHGLPGHKRWLNNAGLQVPFVLHVPDKYRHLVTSLDGPVTGQMVGFVDFAPTVITLAGAEVPGMMEGINFLGALEQNEYIYGYRDRADDCYEVSRSVFDGRYLYVRHFMPQLPYFQDAIIFGPGKEGSYMEIHRLRGLGLLPEGTRRMFARKPVEELFDLENDPWEEHNLINDPAHARLVDHLRGKLDAWMLDYHDTGLLTEGEMMSRAYESNTSVYEMARSLSRDEMEDILSAAQKVGKINAPSELEPYFGAGDSFIRFWALVALDAFEGDISPARPYLEKLLQDPSPDVAVKAAGIMIKHYESRDAYRVLEEVLAHQHEPVVLQAAISVRQLGEKARPLLPVIENRIMPLHSGDVWGRYRNWGYPMFIGMALDQAMINCGIDLGPIPER